jgi:hypothetical protein
MGSVVINELEIVGYAGAFSVGTLPRVVAPIFRFKNDQEKYIFPPFKLISDQVVGGVVGNVGNFQRLLAHGDGTQLRNVILPRSESVLWIENGNIPHYQAAAEHIRNWRAEARKKYREAKLALAREDLPDAQLLARHAFALDERYWQALALQSAVDIRMGNSQGAEALSTVAGDLVDRSEFDTVVESFASDLPDGGSFGSRRNAVSGVGLRPECMQALTGAEAA